MKTQIEGLREFTLSVNTLIETVERLTGLRLEKINCGKVEGDGTGDLLSVATKKVVRNAAKLGV